MKRWLVFLLGFVSGVIFILLLAFIGASSSSRTIDNGMILFEQPGECLNSKAYEVFQVISDNSALAEEVEWSSTLNRYMSTTGLLVLVTNDNGEFYYDDQVIEVPEGKCMRQIGIYKYKTRMDTEKRVPVVTLMDI